MKGQLATCEVGRKEDELARIADVVVMKPERRRISDAVAFPVHARGQMPFREMPQLRPEATRIPIAVGSNDEEIVENLAPWMLFHPLANVCVVHLRRGHREHRPIYRLARRLANRGHSAVRRRGRP